MRERLFVMPMVFDVFFRRDPGLCSRFPYSYWVCEGWNGACLRCSRASMRRGKIRGTPETWNSQITIEKVILEAGNLHRTIGRCVFIIFGFLSILLFLLGSMFDQHEGVVVAELEGNISWV